MSRNLCPGVNEPLQIVLHLIQLQRSTTWKRKTEHLTSYRKKNEKHNWDVQVTQLYASFFAPVAWCISIPPGEDDVDMPQKK